MLVNFDACPRLDQKGVHGIVRSKKEDYGDDSAESSFTLVVQVIDDFFSSLFHFLAVLDKGLIEASTGLTNQRFTEFVGYDSNSRSFIVGLRQKSEFLLVWALALYS